MQSSAQQPKVRISQVPGAAALLTGKPHGIVPPPPRTHQVPPQAQVQPQQSSSKDAKPQFQMPEIIVDTKNKKSYLIGSLLGKGAFGKCYEVQESRTKLIYACKVVNKSLLVKKDQKDKMASEISIHRELSHEYIVKFYSHFEDDSNVYIILELCNRKSLMEMQKRRKYLTDAESRYFFRQIILAISYLHERRIIHRDLKLGNIFITEQMELKMGDFGLATKCDSTMSKRYTLCGTPNYIAPEVLSRKGHSYEVDIWSCGCILYTFLVGSPPFETTTLKDTYAKIRRGEYAVPPGKVSTAAKHLITQMLQLDPSLRPSAKEILNSEYLSKSFIPKAIPQSALTTVPRFNDALLQVSKPAPILGEQNPKSAEAQLPNLGGLANIDPNPGLASKRLTAAYIRKLFDDLTDVTNKLSSSKRVLRTNDDAEDPNSSPLLWISKWVDYSDKYGFGYQLCDDSIGVSFNDATKLVLLPDDNNLQYIDAAGKEKFFQRGSPPPELVKKMKLLSFFQQYMSENLIKAGGSTAKPDYSMARLPNLYTWFRSSRAVVMLLTNGTLQINNFIDHTKTIVCPLLGAISILEREKPMRTYRFELIKYYGATTELVEKITYARDKVEGILGRRAVTQDLEKKD